MIEDISCLPSLWMFWNVLALSLEAAWLSALATMQTPAFEVRHRVLQVL